MYEDNRSIVIKKPSGEITRELIFVGRLKTACTLSAHFSLLKAANPDRTGLYTIHDNLKKGGVA